MTAGIAPSSGPTIGIASASAAMSPSRSAAGTPSSVYATAIPTPSRRHEDELAADPHAQPGLQPGSRCRAPGARAEARHERQHVALETGVLREPEDRRRSAASGATSTAPATVTPTATISSPSGRWRPDERPRCEVHDRGHAPRQRRGPQGRRPLARLIEELGQGGHDRRLELVDGRAARPRTPAR